MKVPETGWDYWLGFLTNNRKANRAKTRQIPFEREGRNVFYSTDDLDEFAKAEKQRRADRAQAQEEAVVRSRGAVRNLQWSVEGRAHSDNGPATVRFKVSGITIGLSLTARQAKELAAELVRHANRFPT
jgi:hypothetical protein